MGDIDYGDLLLVKQPPGEEDATPLEWSDALHNDELVEECPEQDLPKQRPQAKSRAQAPPRRSPPSCPVGRQRTPPAGRVPTRAPGRPAPATRHNPRLADLEDSDEDNDYDYGEEQVDDVEEEEEEGYYDEESQDEGYAPRRGFNQLGDPGRSRGGLGGRGGASARSRGSPARGRGGGRERPMGRHQATNASERKTSSQRRRAGAQVEDGPPMQLMVVGETGSGKSTFINMLTNYFRGGSLDDLKVAIPTSFLGSTEGFKSTEADLGDRSQSKTMACTEYDFKTPQGRELIVIDTPGLSDTRGVQQDDENLDIIFKAAEKATNLAAIIFVINGSVARQTTTLQNVMTRFRGAIPDVVLKNVVIAFTNCWEHDRNFDPAVLGKTFSGAQQFHMKNSAFSSDPDSWSAMTTRLLQSDWDIVMEEIERLVSTVSRMASTSTDAFKSMRKNRDRIKAVLHKARLEISQLQKLQDEIAAAEVAIGRYGADAAQFKNFTRQRTVTQKVLVDAAYHSTLCSTCNAVCHDRCGLQEISSAGSNQFLNCASFNGHATCRMCDNSHDHTTHYHAKKTVQEETKTLDEVLHDVKAKFEAAQKGHGDSSQKLATVKGAKQAIENAIDQMAQEVLDSCNNLKKICSGFNLVDELYVMLTQLEMEARSLQSTEARKSAESFIRSIRQLCDTMSAQQGSSARAGASPLKVQPRPHQAPSALPISASGGAAGAAAGSASPAVSQKKKGFFSKFRS